MPGYPPEKAERKARRQANYLKNKIRRALAALGVSIADAGDMIVSSERLEGNERYRSKLEESRQVFAEDADFHRDCLASSSWVLENQSNGKPVEGPSLRLAANYLLAEMPLFVDSVGILEQDASVFCYHRCIPLISDLYRGRYGLRPSVNQGFTVLPDLAVKLSA